MKKKILQVCYPMIIKNQIYIQWDYFLWGLIWLSLKPTTDVSVLFINNASILIHPLVWCIGTLINWYRRQTNNSLYNIKNGNLCYIQWKDILNTMFFKLN
jgi:hypothetical protein